MVLTTAGGIGSGKHVKETSQVRLTLNRISRKGRDDKIVNELVFFLPDRRRRLACICNGRHENTWSKHASRMSLQGVRSDVGYAHDCVSTKSFGVAFYLSHMYCLREGFPARDICKHCG